MEQTLEHNAARLLDGVTEIIKRYEERWRKTGEKYNLFKVAGIARDEVIMCRVLADLLNPQGKHYQGSRYLKLFWETIKLPGGLSLDVEHTKVTVEYVTNENRRIDIVMEDGKVFMPIEVKIGAPDLLRQLADYFDFAKPKNKGHVPVIYLTVDGHEPSDLSKADLDKDDYVCISFKNEILVWLEACARESATEAAVPVRENLKQLIAAIKSLCGKSEDAEMEDEIFKLVTTNDDTVRTALAIRSALDFDGKARAAFEEAVLPLVNKEYPDAGWDEDDGWYYISIPIDGGKYCLEVNYDWKSFHIAPANNTKRDSKIEEQMGKEMASYTNHKNGNDDGGIFSLWGTNRYPGLEFGDKEWYFYKLYREYTERPQEAANRIIAIANTLESVTA
jgi:hypothetical protein